MVFQHLFGQKPVEQRVDIASAIVRNNPGTTVTAFIEFVEHESIPTSQIHGSLAQIDLRQLLAPLPFELLGKWGVDDPGFLTR